MVRIVSELSEIPQEGIVVIDFFATWCGPCKRIAPVYVELSKKFPKVSFLKVDVDESEQIATTYNVSSLPTFLFLQNGVEVNRIEGADPNTLLKVLQAF